jgi:hypothetical protein
MIDNFLKKQFEFYIEFRNSISRSREDIREGIENSIKKIEKTAESPQEFATKYKSFLYLEEIIKELCENYLIDSNSQDIAREKISLLWGRIKKERETLAEKSNK